MSTHVANHKIRDRYALRENQHMRGNPPNRPYSLKVLWIKHHFVTQFSLTDHFLKIRKISSFMPISFSKLRNCLKLQSDLPYAVRLP